jgi:hypothetical protein
MVGSILSIFMFFKHFAEAYNSFKLEESLIHSVISFYFPDFKKIQITKSITGKIKSAKFNNGYYDTVEF